MDACVPAYVALPGIASSSTSLSPESPNAGSSSPLTIMGSSGQQLTLKLQNDGNLVLYQGTYPSWTDIWVP
jgi:hypothetical protein